MPGIEEIEPLIAVVDFHHARQVLSKPSRTTALTLSRGPEVEFWLGAAEGVDPAADNDWSLLPFMALTDGAHA